VGFVATILSNPCIELTPEQVAQLESQGNRSNNWSAVKLTGAPTASSGYDNYLERIRNCSFSGNIFIGVFLKNTTLERNVSVPSGLYNSNFSGTVILSDNCYVFNCSMVCNAFIGRNSSLVNCGVVTCEGQCSYGTQRTICVGPESDSTNSTHSRALVLNVNSSYAEVCQQAMTISVSHTVPGLPSNKQNQRLAVGVPVGVPGVPVHGSEAAVGMNMMGVDGVGMVGNTANRGGTSSNKAHNHQSQHSMRPSHMQTQSNQSQQDVVRYDMSIICDDVEISHCSHLSNAFIGSYSRVHGSIYHNTTLLSHCSVMNAELTDCVLHNACTVASKAVLNGVLMFPHSEVSQGAVVSECILGPDSGVSMGECKRSLLGPFVGFHHRSLLISSTWPLGRGNIAHGCMIGKCLHFHNNFRSYIVVLTFHRSQSHRKIQ
jgi:carbonic anhydrase/acetyltransferase-like protein (isoleucine patch superfamily)